MMTIPIAPSGVPLERAPTVPVLDEADPVLLERSLLGAVSAEQLLHALAFCVGGTNLMMIHYGQARGAGVSEVASSRTGTRPSGVYVQSPKLAQIASLERGGRVRLWVDGLERQLVGTWACGAAGLADQGHALVNQRAAVVFDRGEPDAPLVVGVIRESGTACARAPRRGESMTAVGAQFPPNPRHAVPFEEQLVIDSGRVVLCIKRAVRVMVQATVVTPLHTPRSTLCP